MSHKTKLWIAGLGFPTLLLLVIALYMLHQSPTVKLIEEIERQKRLKTANLPKGEYVTFLVKGAMPRWWDKTKQVDPYSWKFKYFGSITSLYLTD